MMITTSPIDPKVLAYASIRILSKGDIDTTVLLFDIHRSYGDDVLFCSWCMLAERFGLVGPALHSKFVELGSSVCELLVYVLHRQLHDENFEDPVAIARGLVNIARIRERMTW